MKLDIPEDLLTLIDAQRGPVSRKRYVCAILRGSLTQGVPAQRMPRAYEVRDNVQNNLTGGAQGITCWSATS